MGRVLSGGLMTAEDWRSQVEQPGSGEASRVEAVEALGLLDTPPEERFDRITRLATQIFGVPTALVTLIDQDRQFHKSRQGFIPAQIPREQSFCQVAIQSGEVMVVQDATADARFQDSPLVTGPAHARFYAGFPLAGPGGQRVGALCVLDRHPRAFTAEQCQILRELGSMVERELVMQDEVDRAARVQTQLLPQADPQLPGFDIAAACIPSQDVSGDFYDWYRNDRELTITVADVMGKGLSASIIAATLRGVLRAETRRAGLSGAIQATHLAMREDLEATSMLVTAFHASLAPDGRLRYIDAGHGLAVIARRAGGLERLSVRGLPLGVSGDSTWQVGQDRLAPGDTLLIFSDGLLDLHPSFDETLAAVLTASHEEPGAREVLRRLTACARPARQPDDVTMVVARRRAAG